jgi:hypothetical protein
MILKPWLSKGYPNLTLWQNRKPHKVKVHQIVCRAFHGPKPSPAHEVAHWDGYRANVVASNLRWATKHENHQDAVRHGTTGLNGVRPKGETHHSAKLTKAQVLEITQKYGDVKRPTGTHWGRNRVAAEYGVSGTVIVKILSGHNWKIELGLPSGDPARVLRNNPVTPLAG